MMNNRFIFGAFGLLAVMAVSACAPATPPSRSISNPPTQIEATELPALTPTPLPTLSPVDSAEMPGQTAEVQPIATSRGPNLEATGPTTVRLASGGLQLVEFFRFT